MLQLKNVFLLVVLVYASFSQDAFSQETLIDNFDNTAELSSWSFSNGPEFPGSSGKILPSSGYQKGGVELQYNFKKGGHYVSMQKAVALNAQAVGFWVKSPAGILVKMRVEDSTGQILQFDLNRPLEALNVMSWYPVTVDLNQSTFHYAGANDGRLHLPIRSVSLLAADPLEVESSGSIYFDEMVAYTKLESTLKLDPTALVPAPKGSEDLASRLGIQVHFTEDDRSLDLMQTTRMTKIRMDINWQAAEKQKGIYDFSAHDRLLASLEKRGMQPLFIFDYFNTLYPSSDDPRYEKETVPAFARFAAAAARHFAGHPVAYEVFNEPNGNWFWPNPDARLFAALCKATAFAVHREDPNAKVVTGGIFEFNLPYLRTFLKYGGAIGADAVGVHPYRQVGPETITDSLLKTRELLSSTAPGVQLWQTEWGYPSTWYGHGHSEDARKMAGRLDLREVLVSWAVGFPMTILYDDRDDNTDPLNKEDNFGLIANDYSPKPALKMFQHLGEIAKDRNFSGVYPMQPSTLHAMRLDGKKTGTVSSVIILWSDAASSVTNVTIPKGVKAWDQFGTLLNLNSTSTSQSIEVREDKGPVYLELPISN